MSIDLQHPFDDELRGILENLAGGLFPITDWIGNPNRTFKPREQDLPWREGGHSLSPRDIGVIPFLEALIRETSADAHLIARWQDLTASGNALKFSPIADMQGWRSERNFDPAPTVIDPTPGMPPVGSPPGFGLNPMVTTVANALRVGSWIVEQSGKGDGLG